MLDYTHTHTHTHKHTSNTARTHSELSILLENLHQHHTHTHTHTYTRAQAHTRTHRHTQHRTDTEEPSINHERCKHIIWHGSERVTLGIAVASMLLFLVRGVSKNIHSLLYIALSMHSVPVASSHLPTCIVGGRCLLARVVCISDTVVLVLLPSRSYRKR